MSSPTVEFTPAPIYYFEDPDVVFIWTCPECPPAVLTEAGIEFDLMDGDCAEDHIDDLRASIDDIEGHPEKYLSLCGDASMLELTMALRILLQGMADHRRCYLTVS